MSVNNKCLCPMKFTVATHHDDNSQEADDLQCSGPQNSECKARKNEGVMLKGWPQHTSNRRPWKTPNKSSSNPFNGYLLNEKKKITIKPDSIIYTLVIIFKGTPKFKEKEAKFNGIRIISNLGDQYLVHAPQALMPAWHLLCMLAQFEGWAQDWR